jgi:hypothetical protein
LFPCFLLRFFAKRFFDDRPKSFNANAAMSACPWVMATKAIMARGVMVKAVMMIEAKVSLMMIPSFLLDLDNQVCKQTEPVLLID